MNILQLIRKFWWIVIIAIVATVLFTTSIGILAIAANKPWLNMLLGALLGILAFVAILTPEVTITTILVGFISGLLPGVTITDEVSAFSKAVKRTLIFSAFLISFVHVVGATWPWNGNWLLAFGVMEVSIMLGFATLHFYPDTAATWLRRIAFTYGAIAIIAFLLSAALFPKSKVEEALQSRENAQHEQEDADLARKIYSLPSDGLLTTEDKGIIKKAHEKSPRRKAGTAIENATSASIDILTDPSHRTVVLVSIIVTGLILLWLYKGAKIPAIPVKPLIILTILILTLAFLFQPSRDLILDMVRESRIPEKITGTETVRAVLVTTLDGFDICGLEPNGSYTFVGAKTEKQNGDEVSYKIRHKTSSFEQLCRVTGMFSPTPEKLPYKDGDYAFGILVDGVPPGRVTKSDSSGCLRATFNSESVQYFNIVPISIGVHLRFNGT